MSVNVQGKSITFEPYSDTSLLIYYLNLAGDNVDLNVYITREDTNAVVYNSSSFVDPNNVTIEFDWSALSGVDNTTLFRVVAVGTDSDGDDSSVWQYFNIGGRTGTSLNSGVGFLIAFLITIFGLTLSVSRLSFSWLGIFVCITSIMVLTFTISTWYVLMLQALNVILILFIGITMTWQNYSEVA